jgi:hypothetical protein
MQVSFSSSEFFILSTDILPFNSRFKKPILSTTKASSQPCSNQISTSIKLLSSTAPKQIQMATKKVLVVFGATGVQGGSVVKAILGDAKLRETWTVRGVTRDVSKPSAKVLETLGAETVAVSQSSKSFRVASY